MKRFLSILGLIACIGALTACQSVTVKKSLLVTGESVRSAMNVYGGLYRTGQLTPEEIESVRVAHDQKFIPAYNEAVLLASSDLSQLTPEQVGQLAAEVITLIYTIKGRHP